MTGKGQIHQFRAPQVLDTGLLLGLQRRHLAPALVRFVGRFGLTLRHGRPLRTQAGRPGLLGLFQRSGFAHRAGFLLCLLSLRRSGLLLRFDGAFLRPFLSPPLGESAFEVVEQFLTLLVGEIGHGALLGVWGFSPSP
ncbi:hypothetical protein ASG87_01550 [Frateuria sp. Soil773]|nr:hypothetical protein ASG87_01550 [Frateuria sp. Soil773]